jgi:hypothetical protein
MVMLGLMVLSPLFGLPKGTSIGSVNVKENTVTLVLLRPEQGNKQVQVYKVDPGATITVNGSPATLAKLHKGQKVIGYTEGEPNVLVSLDVQN